MKKILVVENNYILWDSIKSELKKNNFSVTESYTPTFTDAVKQLEKEIPEIVIIDIKLQSESSEEEPLNGIDLAHYIRQRFPSVSIIFLTKYRQYVEHALLSQPNVYLIKDKNNLDVLLANLRILSSQDKNETPKEGVMVYSGSIVKLLKWSDIVVISTTDEAHNTIKIKAFEGNEYNFSSSLSGLASKLPLQFVRVNGKTILNMDFHTKLLASDYRIYIGNEEYRVTPTYRSSFENFLKSKYINRN